MSSELAPSCCSLVGLQVQAGVAGRSYEMQTHSDTPRPALGLWAAAGWLVSSAQRSRVPRGPARGGQANEALRHRQDGAISMLQARRLVEAGAGRDPAGDGVVLAQVVEREADDRRVQHVVRVRVDLRPWRKTREKYNDAGIITVLEIEEQQSVCGP